MSTLFSEHLEACVQFIIGEAFRQHTKESMLYAAHQLKGIQRLLTFATPHSANDITQVNKQMELCYRAADLIERGEL